MADVDRVAEAIWVAEPPMYGIQNRPWTDAYPTTHTKAAYRRTAQAAIDALQLTEEQRTLADGEGGISTNWRTGETTVHSKPCTRLSRLVSPWTKAGEQ